MKLLNITKLTFRDTTYSTAIRFRFAMQYQQCRWHRKQGEANQSPGTTFTEELRSCNNVGGRLDMHILRLTFLSTSLNVCDYCASRNENIIFHSLLSTQSLFSVAYFQWIAKITITSVLRGEEEENAQETQVTCGKTARKLATNAAVAVSILFYLINTAQ